MSLRDFTPEEEQELKDNLRKGLVFKYSDGRHVRLKNHVMLQHLTCEERGMTEEKDIALDELVAGMNGESNNR